MFFIEGVGWKEMKKGACIFATIQIFIYLFSYLYWIGYCPPLSEKEKGVIEEFLKIQDIEGTEAIWMSRGVKEMAGLKFEVKFKRGELGLGCVEKV